MKSPDFIIVGAGSCGCVVARTLLQKGFRVCLIEAGGNLAVNRRPAEYPRLFGGPQDWSFSTVPQPELAGRRLAFPRGRGPGGSTRINAMIWYPPPQHDLQRLHAAGGSFWQPTRLLQSLQQIESWVNPEAPRWLSESTQRVLHGCQSLGWSMQPFRRMNWQGKRRTAFDLIESRWQESGLMTLYQAAVKRICLEGERATAVEVVTPSGHLERIEASRGVMVCGGAIATPQLLFASGIGERDELRKCGIEPIWDQPEAGKQLADHLIMPLIYQRMGSRFLSGATVGDLTRWSYLGTGPLASNLAEAGGLFSIENGVTCQLHITPTHYLLHPSDRSPAALSLGVNLCNPVSRGRLQWMRDPLTGDLQMAIDPAYCTSAADREALLAGLQMARQLGHHLQADGWAQQELIPGERRKGTDADGKAIARFAQTLYHPCGTCRLGVDAGAVVDPELKVHGVERLTVIDASVLPFIPSVNPNALLMTMAYQAAMAVS